MLNSSLRTSYSHHSITFLWSNSIFGWGKNVVITANSANKDSVCNKDCRARYQLERIVFWNSKSWYVGEAGGFFRNLSLWCVADCSCMFLFAKTIAAVHAFANIVWNICILQPLTSLPFWTRWNLCTHTYPYQLARSHCLSVGLLKQRAATIWN